MRERTGFAKVDKIPAELQDMFLAEVRKHGRTFVVQAVKWSQHEQSMRRGRIARSKLGPAFVSTIFLGTRYPDGCTYETMVRRSRAIVHPPFSVFPGQPEREIYRYRTRAEAIYGHRHHVRDVLTMRSPLRRMHTAYRGRRQRR